MLFYFLFICLNFFVIKKILAELGKQLRLHQFSWCDRVRCFISSFSSNEFDDSNGFLILKWRVIQVGVWILWGSECCGLGEIVLQFKWILGSNLLLSQKWLATIHTSFDSDSFYFHCNLSTCKSIQVPTFIVSLLVP